VKKITIATLTIIVAAATFTWATTVRPMSVDRLTQLATTIVEAHVSQTWSEWDPAHTRIYTYTRLAVSKSLKGSQVSTILVKQPGGTKDGIREVAFGVRHFRSGEDAFLFLEPDASNDGAFRVVGLMQGNFLIGKTSNGKLMVSNGMPQVTVLNSRGQRGPYAGERMTLQELETSVTKAVAK